MRRRNYAPAPGIFSMTTEPSYDDHRRNVFVHSHPDQPPFPSDADFEWAKRKPERGVFGIYSTKTDVLMVFLASGEGVPVLHVA